MSGRGMKDILAALQERAKELSCLYLVVELLHDTEAPSDETLRRVLDALPAGWQFPGICQPMLVVGERTYRGHGFRETPWVQRAEVRVRGETVGELSVWYAEERPAADEGPFLKEERQLLNTLAERIGLYLLERETVRNGRGDASPASTSADERRSARIVVEFLKRMDARLVERLTRRMLNHLRWEGSTEADALLDHGRPTPGDADGEPNRALTSGAVDESPVSVDEVFRLAAERYGDEELLGYLQMWISQDRVSFLVGALEDQGSSLAELTEALERFHALGLDEDELSHSVRVMLRVGLLRRFFTDQIGFINTAKGLVRMEDFLDLARHVVHPPGGGGKLGGKSTGLFLARKIVEAAPERDAILQDVRVPRTWYVSSDGVMAFVRHSQLEDVYDLKYREIDQVRHQYPHIVNVFRGSPFPPALVKGIATALDDLEERPLIVRSSSLLEDRTGAVFSGKYKSLFLANQGTRTERLRALLAAIAEVYASIFGPDPIEYRAERNLLDVHEEMGIMIQEVVGTRVGRYFLPAFSGVAFTHNEFRWSPRIERDDGLVRLVPGLGTRAVDRTSDDYPVLLAPRKPRLRVNTSPDEAVRYSPKKIDLIDLEANSFATVDLEAFLRECGNDLPQMRRIVSLIGDGHLRRPSALTVDFERERAAVTFEGLASETPFMTQVATLLEVLADRLGTPVDLEFASDGSDLYLLQCRPQSHGPLTAPAVLPRNPDPGRVLFSAHRSITNGRVPGIGHVVYVDPDRYGELPNRQSLLEVGRAVGVLNKLLPKRAFILVGPGRWGSRGDIRMGVQVGYADINNTALLVEVARRKGGYLPDLSFGTHFFQDLVEAGIRYLPLYPGESGDHFDEAFLRGAPNRLAELAPAFDHLAEVVRVVDVRAATGGRVLEVLMNAETDQALGLFTDPEPA